MSTRENIKPLYRWMPKWVLLSVVCSLGLAVHLAAGVREGLTSFFAELRQIWNLD